MKIERISENQIKLILTRSELLERNIKIEDLTKTTEKTTELFRDIMEKAFIECGFKVENAPLMVEAMPLPVDGVLIIVTKLNENKIDDIDNRFSVIKKSKQLNGINSFKRKPLYNIEKELKADEDSIVIYSFSNIDDIISMSERINKKFDGLSSLYKYDGKYFILLQNISNEKKLKFSIIDDIICEYGQKHISNILSKYFLIEHGEIIIENKAIDILCSNFV